MLGQQFLAATRWMRRRFELTKQPLRTNRGHRLVIETLEGRAVLSADVAITEFMASNGRTLLDGDGNSSDWIEIHNAGDTGLDLIGYHLTDEPRKPRKWSFPSVELAPGQYLVVFASGQDSENYVDGERNFHTNFKLSTDGEYVALVAPKGAVVSEYGSYTTTYPKQLRDVSYGIGTVESGDAEPRLGYMVTPTPGKPNVGNEQVFAGFVRDIQLSVNPGFHDGPFKLELTSDTPHATIRYTTDGSSPSDTHGTIYSGQFTISHTTILRTAAFKRGYISTKVNTHSYIFLDDVLEQNGKAMPTSWGTHQGTWGNVGPPYVSLFGTPVQPNYDMDPEVVNDPRYRHTLKNDLRSIRTLSLVLDPADLWSEETGIYSYPLQRGVDWERPGSIELFDTEGNLDLQIDAGVRIHGGMGRNPEHTNKHSFRLLFKNEYGPSKLEYPLFGENATDEFDSIVLRANTNESWALDGSTMATFVQDRWAAETQLEMGWVAPHGNWVHLYLNGLYWGLYNPTERLDAAFAANYFGGQKEQYDVIAYGQIKEGDKQAWNELFYLIRQRQIDYDAVQEVLDVPAFIDYMLINHLAGNTDWPHNNWYASRRREPGAKWYFHSWDAEHSWRDINENRVTPRQFLGKGNAGEIYAKLLDKVEQFRVDFADRIHRHFFNGGLLTPEANVRRLDRLTAAIDRAVVGESARWGDGKWDETEPPRTRDDHWLPRLKDLKTSYFPARSDIVLQQYREVGLYPDVDAPEFNQVSATVSGPFAVGIRTFGNHGTVYYTTDGTDPRLPDGGVNQQALVYHGGRISIRGGTQLKARVLDAGTWSALNEATFALNDQAPHTAQPGDANRDGAFDHFDIVRVLQEGNYRTGQSSDWSRGDWNNDGAFDALDIVAALQTGNYLLGPYITPYTGETLTFPKDADDTDTQRLDSLYAALLGF
jgi:hypothetical protein